MKSDDVDSATRGRAVAAALGREPFDLLLVGGTIVDVATGELRPADVGIVGPLIASVHETGTRTDANTVHEIFGRYVAPGFLDMHVHFESSMLTPGAYAEAVLPHGTTTVFADPHELANVAGVDGVRYAVEASRDLPLRFVFQAPSCVPPIVGLELSGADFDATHVSEMLTWPAMAGVAEVMDMAGVLERDERMVRIVDAGINAAKLVSGHAFGLSGAVLQAYLAAGITSDHEVLAESDVLERLRAGMTVELRYALEHFLPSLVQELKALPQVPTLLCAASDDVLAVDLLERGNIDVLLRLLIEHGLDAVEAIRIATLNGAYRLGRTDLGLIGPGRQADLVTMTEIESLTIEDVYTGGVRRARDGVLLSPIEEAPSMPPLDTVQLGELTPDDFRLKLDLPDGAATVRVIAGQLFTTWDEIDVDVRDGVVAIPPGHILQVAIHRFGRRPVAPRHALLSGWGDWRGAIATTVAHDTHNLVVFGADPYDMAAAANAVIEAGGGIAVASEATVTAMIKLPIAGLLAEGSAHEVAQQQRALEAAARAVGLEAPLLRHPLVAVTVSSLACLPGPHLTDVGLVDGSTGEQVESMVLT